MSDRIKYRLPYDIIYTSHRYGKIKTVPKGYPSDGASGPALDIWSESWWVHDALCDGRTGEIPPEAIGYWETDGLWDDGSRCSVLESSMVLYDILKSEGRPIRAPLWAFATFVARIAMRQS